jgi:hypothetical protein
MNVGSVIRIKRGCGTVSTWMWGRLGICTNIIIRPPDASQYIKIRIPLDGEGHCNQVVLLDDVEEV